MSSRARIWLPLLGSLSRVDSWFVYKNVESALTGTGDIDSCADPQDWDTLTQLHEAWSEDIGPRVVCRHIPGGINLVTLIRRSNELLEVGIKERKTYRGSTLFAWNRLIDLTEIDDDGVRLLREGAEGAIKLILNGVARDGSPDWDAMSAKGVIENVTADPEGAEMAAGRLLGGRVSQSIKSLLRAVAFGSWDRAAAKRIQRSAYVGVLSEPGLAIRRLRFQLTKADLCPVTRVLLVHGRVVPGDPSVWWAEVEESHPGEAGTL